MTLMSQNKRLTLKDMYSIGYFTSFNGECECVFCVSELDWIFYKWMKPDGWLVFEGSVIDYEFF